MQMFINGNIGIILSSIYGTVLTLFAHIIFSIADSKLISNEKESLTFEINTYLLFCKVDLLAAICTCVFCNAEHVLSNQPYTFENYNSSMTENIKIFIPEKGQFSAILKF